MSKDEERRYEFKFSKTQIALLFAGIGIMAAVMFSLGTVVGRSLGEINTIISKPATPPAGVALQPAQPQPPPQAAPPVPAASPAPQEVVPPPPPTVHAQAPEQMKADEPSVAAQAEKQPTAAQTEEKVAPAGVEKTAKEEPHAQPTMGKPEKQPRKTVKKPAAKPVATKAAGPNAPHKTYMLQVGSFAVKADADQLAKKLRRKGFKTTVLPIEVEGKGMWYRVRTGPYPDRQAADKNLQKLQQINGLTPLVIAAS